MSLCNRNLLANHVNSITPLKKYVLIKNQKNKLFYYKLPNDLTTVQSTIVKTTNHVFQS